MSDKARQHLPFLGFFSGRVNADWLELLSKEDECGKAYQAVFGNNLQKSDWQKILNEAKETGIVEHFGGTLYKIHPTLPWYLRQRIYKFHGEKEVNELEKKLLFFYAGFANYCNQEIISNANRAILVLWYEESNLLQNLRLAEQQQQWAEAQAILQALGNFYQRQTRKSEFRSLRQRAVLRRR